MAEDARGSIKEDLWQQNECQNERTLRAAGSKSCDQFNFKDAETLWDSTIFRLKEESSISCLWHSF